MKPCVWRRLRPKTAWIINAVVMVLLSSQKVTEPRFTNALLYSLQLLTLYFIFAILRILKWVWVFWDQTEEVEISAIDLGNKTHIG